MAAEIACNTFSPTIGDKVGENAKVMKQIENIAPDRAMLGDFSKAIDDAITDSSEAHQNQMLQLLADPRNAANFARTVFDLLVQGPPKNYGSGILPPRGVRLNLAFAFQEPAICRQFV